jgi:hypothetical protein
MGEKTDTLTEQMKAQLSASHLEIRWALY